MKIAERIVMVALLLIFIGGGAWIYFAVQFEHKEIVDAVANHEYEIPLDAKDPVIPREDWRSIYPNTITVLVGSTTVKASVADTLSKRIKGLSNTPFMPDDVVKLFAFGVEGTHSVWMKDMNYAIDIIWVAKDGSIVHIEENVSPDSYPEAYSSPTPAFYVIETVSGFVDYNQTVLGDKVVLPTQ
ncbi:MAG: DUF192 domain-containing protein [Candidatus Pacebacteria bacterium]|nr:DUF192 domain-containing protein [Candidatus Paceibacterota bacterium]